MSFTQRNIQSPPHDCVPLFALLIGISRYEVPPQGAGMPALHAAVSDVILFKDYLETELSVPRNQINLLINEYATRSGIIAAMEGLKVNPNIQHNDAIVIYFAGHGAQIDVPENWEWTDLDGKVQAIVPYDYNTRKPGGERVLPITDYTFSRLLSEISQKHGENITVVFDCCYSASSTRAPLNLDTSELTDRLVGLSSSGHYPTILYQQILPDSPSIRNTDITSLESHVHLTISSSKGLAYESFSQPEGKSRRIRCGRLSAPLLKLLYQTLPHRFLYSDILSSFSSIQDQNPHCEGRYKVLPAVFHNSFEVVYQSGFNRSRGYYVIKAGNFHDNTAKSQFALYSDNNIVHSKPVKRLVAILVENSRTLAVPPGNVNIKLTPTRKAIAAPTNPGEGDSLLIWKDPTFVYKYKKNKQKAQLQDFALATTQRASGIGLEVTKPTTLPLEIFKDPAIHRQAQNSTGGRVDKVRADDVDLLSYILCHESNFLWRA